MVTISLQIFLFSLILTLPVIFIRRGGEGRGEGEEGPRRFFVAFQSVKREWGEGVAGRETEREILPRPIATGQGKVSYPERRQI